MYAQLKSQTIDSDKIFRLYDVDQDDKLDQNEFKTLNAELWPVLIQYCEDTSPEIKSMMKRSMHGGGSMFGGFLAAGVSNLAVDQVIQVVKDSAKKAGDTEKVNEVFKRLAEDGKITRERFGTHLSELKEVLEPIEDLKADLKKGKVL